MGENSKIQWCDHTFNPWIGCSKVSAGCANCYAEADMDKRRGRVKWGPNGTRSVTSEGYWKQPLKWNRDAECINSFDCNANDHSDACQQSTRPRVFCASLADVFEDWDGDIRDSHGCILFHCHKCFTYNTGHYCGKCGTEIITAGMSDVRRRLFELIDDTPHLDWLLLTKRPENIRRMTPPYSYHACVTGDCPHEFERDCDKNTGFRDNVWLLTSCEDQETADERIPHLLQCRDLAPVLGLSCEPLLGPILLCDLQRESEDGQAYDWIGHGQINWVICGGESGRNARPMHPDWALSLRDQCKAAGVPFFFKQWGGWRQPLTGEEYDTSKGRSQNRPCFLVDMVGNVHCYRESASQGAVPMLRVGKKAAGRLLDGVEHNEFPEAKCNTAT